MTGLSLAVNVAVIDEGRILLLKRENFEVWCLPGGQVDEGESFGVAAVREALEETGLVVHLERLVGLYSRPSWGRPHTVALFSATRVGGELTPCPTEVTELGYYSPDALPEPLLWGQRERIHDAVSGLGGSVVRTNDVVRPPGWPTERSAFYALRDASGLAREEFYLGASAGLGTEESRREV